jgi:hypothetical protein
MAARHLRITPDEALEHLDIVARQLRYTDGVRLMSGA